MAIGTRGKVAEGRVQKWLARQGEREVSFDWERVYDARSAGGKFGARTGDFVFFSAGTNGAIEVKEVEHDFRLPAKNFDKAQIARLFKRELAGGKAVVLVLHTTTGKWRSAPLSYFRERLSQPSWDLSEFPAYDDVAGILEQVVLGG